MVLFSIPAVQTKVAKLITKSINEKYQTNIVIKAVDLSFLGNIELEGIEIRDHHNDSLLFINSLSTSLRSFKNAINNNLLFGEIAVEGLRLNMNTYQGEVNDNLSIFVNKLDSGKPSSSNTPFHLASSHIQLENSFFELRNENKETQEVLQLNELNGAVKDFEIVGPKVVADLRGVKFKEGRGIDVVNLTTNFTYTPTQMRFEKFSLETPFSLIKTEMKMDYRRGDLADFVNKVNIYAEFSDAKASLIDINKFYNELGVNDVVLFDGIFTGTINDFKLSGLDLISNRNSVIKGDFHFRNVLNPSEFSLQTDVKKVASTYQNLKMLLPNIIGKSLPSTFEKFGRFNIDGYSYITDESVDADLHINSALGVIYADLNLTHIDDIDNAKYIGDIRFVDLEFGKLIQDSLVGQLSLTAEVDGKGFTLETINTSVKGAISKHQYKGYTYKNIAINGVFKNQHFDGSLVTNDENLKMSFTGLADLSKDLYTFDFIADVEFANFNKLNLFKRDSIAILKGDIDIKITGTNLENARGSINFQNASYTNQNDNYIFKDFSVTSSFKDSVRTLTMNSTDFVEGKIAGRFKFNELGKLATNSFASVYSNYKPKTVSSGQFLDFNFKIYNTIVEVFLPGVNLGSNSTVKGSINSDDDQFELTVISPKIEFYDNVIEKIKLQIDNKSPLFNTLLTVDKANTKYYDFKDVSLVNVTLNDTLFFRTDFTGGKNNQEIYDLSFYHTINKENKSVVGLKKSTVNLRGKEWVLNPTQNKQNKVVFDSSFDFFAFDKFNMVAEDQEIAFGGVINGKFDKNLDINLTNVKLEGFTSFLNDANMKGLINGHINFRETNGDAFPIANITIGDFYLNNFKQGDLILSAKGRGAIKQYDVEAKLTNDNVETVLISGIVDTDGAYPQLMANYNFSDYNIEPYGFFAKDVLNNIRGVVSGTGVISGRLSNPDINGALFLDDAGFGIPYLNVDYSFDGNARIDIKGNTFIVVRGDIYDVDYKTKGRISGELWHQNFTEWFLSLNVDTENLLVLNTSYNPEQPYYGKGFMNGNAIISGPTDNLGIEVVATTMPGTEFIVPLSDVSTIGNSKLIKFVTKAKEEEAGGEVKDIVIDELKGLDLKFDLTVTKDAIAEIVVDKNTGSILRGSGDGNLEINIDTNGKFEMFGTYIVDNGIYEFRNIVNKDFIVQPGGQVIWAGNPFDAYLKVEAIYRTKANPSVLLENFPGQQKIDVDLVAKISGQLLNAEMTFDVLLPNQSSIVNSELAFKMPDQDSKLLQAFSILTTGSFMDTGQGSLNFDSNAALYGTISEKIANVMSGILRTQGDVFNLGVTYDIASKNDFNNYYLDDQLGISVSSTIADKLTVNGKAYVPVGSKTNNNIVGEIEAEYALNNEGTLQLKAYTKQNDIEYDANDAEGYTHGVGVSWRVDYDTSKELLHKMFKIKSKNKRRNVSIDSTKTKKLIKYIAPKSDTLKKPLPKK
ncbi:translocation/assembly module TamB [Flavobacteriaceae bacterium F08102]|nr:translocation/assembly module TamB [Flavobacteriaceae bacterium F08102]